MPSFLVPSPPPLASPCVPLNVFRKLAGIACLTVLVVVAFSTILRQVSETTTYFTAFKYKRNIHVGDAAASHTVKTRPDVGKVLVGKPAVYEFPGL